MGRLYNIVVWILLMGLWFFKMGFLLMCLVGWGVLEYFVNFGFFVFFEKKIIYKLLIDDFIIFIIYDLWYKF